MAGRLAQVSFAKGEVSPEVASRFDVAARASGVAKARNVRVMKYGGLTKRMGTRLVAEVHDASRPVRLIAFQFSLEQTYALEFGHGYMRPAALGGMVLETELVVSAVTTGGTTVIAAAFHGYSAGDRIYLSGGDGALGEALNDRFWTVLSTPDANTVVIDADTTGLTFTGWTGGETRTGASEPDPTPPDVSDPVDPPDPPPVGGGRGRFNKQFPPDGEYA